MNMVLRFFLFCGLLLYFYLILLFLKRKSLNLKYSLLWIFSGVLMLVSKLNDRIKRLIQANALLERRIRELEKK